MITNKTTWLLAGLLYLVLWPAHAFAQDVEGDEIHHAASKGDAERVADLLQARPELVNAKTRRGRTPLHFAAESGHKAMVEWLLANEADPNVTDEFGATPLHDAAFARQVDVLASNFSAAGLTSEIVRDVISRGDLTRLRELLPGDSKLDDLFDGTALPQAVEAEKMAIVQMLVAAGVDLNVPNRFGQTALHLAAQNPTKDVAEILLAGKSTVNARDKWGQTPLHYAALWGLTEVVEVLLANQADPNAKNQLGNTPLYMASMHGHRYIVELLLASAANASTNTKNSDGWTPLNRAAAEGHYKIAEMLFDNGADLHAKDNEGFTPLITAAENGHKDIVELFLAQGADVHARTSDGRTALHATTFGGHRDVAELLLSHKAEINIKDNYGSSALLKAASYGHKAMVVLLLANGADVATKNNAGITPLRWAAANGQTDVAKLLLANRAAVNAEDDRGGTPLHGAAEGGHKAMAEVLLAHGADVTAKDQHGAAPLHWAATNGHADVVELLLAHQADVNAKDAYGQTPLYIAAIAGHKSVSEVLVARRANVNSKSVQGSTPLHQAAGLGHGAVAGILLTNQADVDARDVDGATPLHYAAGKVDENDLKAGRRALGMREPEDPTALTALLGTEHQAVAELLLAQGAEVNARTNDGVTPLMLAAGNGHRDVANLLLTHGAELTARATNDFMPLHKAADQGQPAVAELLLAHGADVNAKVNDGRVPLHLAAQAHLVQQGDLAKESGYRAVAELLLAHNADLTVQDDNGLTPLLTAALGGNPFAVELLLVNGASINARDIWGQTALHLAAHAGHSTQARYKEVTKILLARGANVNAKASSGQTPLHRAAEKGHVAVAEVLVTHNADVMARDVNGATALHWAALAGHKMLAELLLVNKAEVNAKNSKGATPLHLAVWNGHEAVLKVLLAHRAEVSAPDENAHTPLHWAADKGDVAIAELLLASRAEVNAKASNGNTPLHLVAEKGHLAMAELLLTHRADPNAQARNGHTALHIAAQKGYPQLAEALLANNANVNAKNFYGDTPLMWAADKGRVEVVVLLLANQADINSRNMLGQTALHVAALAGHKTVSEVLLGHGADVNARNNRGYTPLDLVTGAANNDLAELLRKHMITVAEETDFGLVGAAVGEFGDPGRLVFEGAETFTEKALIRRLMENPDFLLASHTAAPLAEYLQTLRRLLLSGFQANGFPRAEVTTSVDRSAGRVVVKVAEGPRYVTGGVRVLGAKTIPVEQLIRRLTELSPALESATPAFTFDTDDLESSDVSELPLFGPEQPDSAGKKVEPEPPIWQKGKPAPFAEASLNGLADGVTRAFHQLGYFFAKANVRVIPGDEKGAADLLVDILDEGPRAVIGRIDVTGNRKNTRDEILEYLGLTLGMAFSRDLVMKTEILLWRSARFLDYEVSAEFLDVTGAQEPKVKLNIKLTEYDPAPPLFKELSHEERALLNLRDWLADVPYPSEDIVISIDRQRSESRTEVVKIIISHRRALVLISDGGAGGQGKLRYAGVFSPEIVALYSPARRRKLVDIGPRRQLWTKVSILPVPDPDVEERFGLLFSAGIKTHVFENGVNPFRFDILVAPVVFVAAAHSKNHTYAFSEGVLTISNKHERILVDAQSGKLLEYTGSIPEQIDDEPEGGMHPPLSLPPTFDLIRPEAAFDPPVQLPELGFTVIPEKGAFDRAIKELEEATSGHRNFMDAQTPLSSWVGYLADELFQTEFLDSSLLKDIPTEQRGRALSALRKIFPRPILSPLDKLISRYSAEQGESFYIPSDWPETTEAATDSLSFFLSAVTYRFTDEFFSQGTWPPAAARAAFFLFGGENRYAQAELKRVYDSEETGPLGYLTIATLLTYIGEAATTIEHPAPADFARRGLERLSATDFRKDVRLFITADSILKESIEEMAAALRDLDDQDIEALAALLPPGAGNSVPQIVRGMVWLLREGKDKPIEEALYPALEKYWDKMLKRQVETALRNLAATKAAKLAPELPFSETTLTEVRSVREGLLADREHARHTDEVIWQRRDSPAVTQPTLMPQLPLPVSSTMRATATLRPLAPTKSGPVSAAPPVFPAVKAKAPELDVAARAITAGGIIKEIRIEGTQRIEPETVRSYMRVNPGDTFDPLRLDQSLKNLFSTGLFADVTLRREGGALIVTVVENPVVNRIAFEGNDRIDDQTLAAEMTLRPRVVFTRTKAQRDTQRLLDIYRRSGRHGATVEPKVIQLPQNRIDLVFEINEGPLIVIRQINFIGNRAVSDGRLREEISSTDTYDPDRLTFDRELLRRYYLKEGYADFRVASVVAELLPDRQDFIVTFTVEEGERQKFGQIDISITLPRLDPETLRQHVTAEEGEWYNAEEVEETVNKLTEAVGNLGYAFVDIRPRAERDRENRLVHITFEIQEGPKVFVERIDIHGNERTLDRVIRREFQLVEGDALNSAKLRRSRQRIRNLGFFGTVDVETRQGSAPDTSVITVKVEEQSTGDLTFGASVSSVEGPTVNVSLRERNLLGRSQDVWLSIKLTGRGQQLDLSFFEPYFLASKSTRARPPALGACEQSVQIRGNLPDPDVVSKISPGIHSRIDIQSLLGSPSSVSTFQDTTWYYIGQTTTQFGFCEPDVLERKVLVVSFDDIGLVADTKTYTLEDGQIIDPVDRITPTKGRETFAAPRPPGPLHRPRRRPAGHPEPEGRG